METSGQGEFSLFLLCLKASTTYEYGSLAHNGRTIFDLEAHKENGSLNHAFVCIFLKENVKIKLCLVVGSNEENGWEASK